MKHKCEKCNDTGWYSDNGPGFKKNAGCLLCECKNKTTNPPTPAPTDEEWKCLAPEYCGDDRIAFVCDVCSLTSRLASKITEVEELRKFIDSKLKGNDMADAIGYGVSSDLRLRIMYLTKRQKSAAEAFKTIHWHTADKDFDLKAIRDVCDKWLKETGEINGQE